AGLLLFLRDRDRHLRHHLPDALVPGPGAWLQRAGDRAGGVLHRHIPDHVDPALLLAGQPRRFALADDGGTGDVCAVDVELRADHARLGRAATAAAASLAWRRPAVRG